MNQTNWSDDADEQMRLDALKQYHILDTGPEQQFDDIVTLVSSICNTPMATVSLVDEHRQWFKSRLGIALDETPREIAFCDHAIRQTDIFVINDATRDHRFSDNPLVTGPPFFRFYAGAPLVNRDGFVLGTLAVLDVVPRTLTQEQRQAMSILSRQVVAQLELRRSLDVLARTIEERDRTQQQLRLSHKHLENRVADRTAALNIANASLKAQFEETEKQAVQSQAIIDSLPGIFYVFDENGEFVRWNKNLERVTGYSGEEVARARMRDFFGSDEDKILAEEKMRTVLAEGKATLEADLVTRSGRRIPYYFTGVRINLDGRVCSAGMGFDITEQRRSEESLRLRNRAIQASVNAIVITDLEGNIEYTNPAFERITGYPVAESVGRNCRFLQGDDTQQSGVTALREAVHKREERSVLLRNYRKSGELFWNDVHIAPVRGPDGKVTHFVGVLNDITEIKHYEQELERQANFDSLTALANRNVLTDRILQAIAAAQRNGTFMTVGFMDLDNFKFINDSLGHNIGDELLKGVAQRLAACLRGQDTIARYGGDEFAFVLVGQKDEKSIAALMERILKTVGHPFDVQGHKLFVSCSIGLAAYPKDGKDADTLLKNADAAMYRAKERGRNNFQFYTPAMNKRVTERLSLESKLRQALAGNEFALHYQPKVDLRSGLIVGVEALLRWHTTSGGVVSPSSFIPLAEETGLIVPLGEWVLYTACAQARALQDAGFPPLRVAVNISARQFERESLVNMIREALETSGLEPNYLELELTESLVMENPQEVIKILHDLKGMGLLIAIDDFGTGYSSLGYLQRFPVDRLKIDQSFVRDIGADPNDAIIARAIISLGHSLGMSVIAEGVSSVEQLAFLRENDCDEMQGFLFSRALPIDELTLLLKDNHNLGAH
ncbi:MAG TPA: EAL domain-containing protein [Noviherbaspirillum sp.]|uniref:sensor domain-containing phosphodiesterase n=1 Tax=Noviherbaspirillum sp. TaxID=1926288 RepID=UPI002B471C5C|nr:EAL domain-containing protein [Noviherbaspirillum sp.]HJV85112.1 EAL domain-containing protein [Noviherbaspirillum sp.]